MAALRRAARFPGHERGDGLFVESLMAALSQTGPEAATRLAEFVGKQSVKVKPPDKALTAAPHRL